MSSGRVNTTTIGLFPFFSIHRGDYLRTPSQDIEEMSNQNEQIPGTNRTNQPILPNQPQTTSQQPPQQPPVDGQQPQQETQQQQQQQQPEYLSYPALLMHLILYIPQVIAAIFVYSMESTNHAGGCSGNEITRWIVWGSVHALRLTMSSLVLTYIYKSRERLASDTRLLLRWHNIRNFVDTIGIAWFVVGNLWIIGEDTVNCPNPAHSPVYNMSLAMLILTYIQLLLPCLLALLLVPILCCCMPCVIRILQRHAPHLVRPVNQGVAGLQAERLPSVVPPTIVTSSTFVEGEERTCPICLEEMDSLGTEIRILPCGHKFHAGCSQEWLVLHATCPTCRERIVDPNSVSDNTNSNLNSSDPPLPPV